MPPVPPLPPKKKTVKNLILYDIQVRLYNIELAMYQKEHPEYVAPE